MPYSGNNFVPITSKVPDQQARFVHTKVKSKINRGPISMAMKTTTAAMTSTVSTAAATKQLAPNKKPLDVLKTILSSPDTSTSDGSATAAQQQTTTSLLTPKTLTFEKPSEEDINAYDLETVRAVRGNNLELLRQLWESGKSMDACNQFGESVLHMACRRGYSGIVDFLLQEVKVKTGRCDDFGRNPFHDALWTPTPNFDVMNLLIEHADPALLLSEDVRGNTPFAYARNDHSDQWISFLEKRKDKLVQRIRGEAASTGENSLGKKVEVVG